MSQPIILYDLANALSLEKRSYSAYVGRIRIILNYKSLPFKTVWMEYADIQQGLKDLGAPPSETMPDGVTPRYSVPTIYDPNTGKWAAESLNIAQYLDAQYPTPGRQVITPGAEDLLLEYGRSAVRFLGPAFPIMITRVYRIFTSRNQPSFNDTLLPIIGGGPPLGERPPPTISQVQEFYAACSRMANGLDEVNRQLRSSGRYNEDELNFAEVCAVAVLKMFLAITSDAEFATILDQEDGRLRRLYERAHVYLATDEGEWYKRKEQVVGE